MFTQPSRGSAEPSPVSPPEAWVEDPPPPFQCRGDEGVGPFAVEVDNLGQISALHGRTHLVDGPHPVELEVHDHTPMIAAPRPSALSMDKTEPLAYDASVLGFDEGVVVGVAGAGFGESPHVELGQEGGDPKGKIYRSLGYRHRQACASGIPRVNSTSKPGSANSSAMPAGLRSAAGDKSRRKPRTCPVNRSRRMVIGRSVSPSSVKDPPGPDIVMLA